MEQNERVAGLRVMADEKAQALRTSLAIDLEHALAAGIEQGRDVVVGPLESDMVDGVLTLRVRRELITAAAPTPEGWTRYPTSKGLPR